MERIEVNPNIMAGKPVIRGTRIPVSVVLNLLAHGYTPSRVIEAYPQITTQDVQAAMSFAASLANMEERVYGVIQPV
ncbi:DUF433 domain-containing protein [Candidatus Uhrbacteria bacterium]|nr:DUF433 domain-containing protein [Candidatus Uhrbacteria bacterium]